MACADIVGRWKESILVVDTTDEVIVEETVRFSAGTVVGTFRGKFDGAGEVFFDVECTNDGPAARIRFTRIQTGGRTTEYTGKVVSFGARGVGIIRGRFTRNSIVAERENIVTNGDWETEKPT